MTRRQFIAYLGYASLTSVCFRLDALAKSVSNAKPSQSLDTFRAPMLRLHEKISEPLVIKNIQILKKDADGKPPALYIRVIAQNGAVGVIEANNRMPQVISLFKELVVPFFIGKDARDIETLVDAVYADGSNYKFAGMPFWNAVSNLEIALFDMMSRVVQQPVYALLGKKIRDDVQVYLTRLTRETSPEQEVEAITRDFAETGCYAVKIKVGGRMNRDDLLPQRTERLIKLARRQLGDDAVIYADANGSYNSTTAIEVGKMLQDYGVKIWEEPCPWQDYESTKVVADALEMPIAGGEQDTSPWQFKSMIERRIVDVVQPDLFYNGGFVRTLRVAKMAADAGLTIDCHSPKYGIAASAFRHFLSVVPNIGMYQEYNYNSQSRPLREIKNGKISLPTNIGLGVEYRVRDFEKMQIL